MSGEHDEFEYIPEVTALDAGIELQSYGLKGCQSPEAWKKRLRDHVTFRKNYPGPLAVHGPFIGIEYMHLDHLLREAVSQRMELTFQAAIRLNASRLILHTGFKQEVLMFDFMDKWIEGTTVFWRKEISRYADQGITVVMENVVESDPTALIELHDRVDHDHFKLCLDVGHANLFSELPLAAWIEKMGSRLVHLHIHDNLGRLDEHLPLGRGNIQFDVVFEALHKVVPNVTASLEVNSDKDTIMANLREMIQRCKGGG
jgi:sugar phosphate isomerase/epimerase